MKHFTCRECGNLFAAVNFSERTPYCCHEKMDEVVPKRGEAGEKHTPRIKVSQNRVTVSAGEGVNTHPQTEEHGVRWICLVTDKGSQRRLLAPEGRPEAHFMLSDGEQVISAFSYCNLHGLWVTECKNSCCCK
jgi:superoxide reductase